MHRLGIMDYLICDLEDKIENPLDEEQVSKIIDQELDSEDWRIVATHNNIGEYGHPHHHQVHLEVVKKMQERGNARKLWVFDKQKDKVEEHILEKKERILKEVYKSQIEIIDQLKENRGRWFIDKDMETNYIENGIISRWEDSSTKGDEFISCYLK